MNDLMSWIIRGAVVLNLLAFLADEAWLKDSNNPGYFRYTMALLDGIPYWLFATLLFLAVNGAASLYFSHVNVQVSAQDRRIRGGFPLPQMQLLGVNILLIPFFILLFIVIRAIGL